MFNTKDENLKKLRKNLKENSRSFIFIIGAGMSREAGMPSWRQLADGLIERYEMLLDEKSTK